MSMLPTAASSATTTATSGRSRLLLSSALVAAVLMTGTLVLWAYYGTAVFFEIVRTGWLACF
jgi:hypothetical protein